MQVNTDSADVIPADSILLPLLCLFNQGAQTNVFRISQDQY